MNIEIEKLKLSVCVYNKEKVSNELILDLLNYYTEQDTKIFRVLLCVGSDQTNSEIAFKEYQQYIYDLVDQVVSLSQIECNEQLLELYKIFTLASLNIKNISQNDINAIMDIYKVIDSRTYSTDFENYMQYKIRYSLLLLYVSNLDKYYKDAKNLLVKLEESKITDISFLL